MKTSKKLRIFIISTFMFVAGGCIEKQFCDVQAGPSDLGNRACDWSRIGAWILEGGEYKWGDYFFGGSPNPFEGSYSVGFTPAWGGLLLHYCVTNFFCENSTKEMLGIKGFPSFANAIELEGNFDISTATVGNNVEYLSLRKMSPESLSGSARMFKDFNESKLKFLELECSTELSKKCSFLELTGYSGLHKLKELTVYSFYPIKGLEQIFAENEIERAFVTLLYDRDELQNCCDETEGDYNGDSVSFAGFFDDASFEEFLLKDFSVFDDIKLKIRLSATRGFNISHLLKGKQANRRIDIDVVNCFVNGLGEIASYKNLQYCIVGIEIDAEVLKQDLFR